MIDSVINTDCFKSYVISRPKKQNVKIFKNKNNIKKLLLKNIKKT